MQKGMKIGYKGMTQDFAKSKAPGEFYYSGNNIRIITTDESSSYAMTNEHGNELSFTIPTPIFDYLNKRIEYLDIDNSTKYLTYENETGIPMDVEIEKDFVQNIVGVISNKVSGIQEIIGVEYSRKGLIIFTTDSNGFDCIWEIKDLNSVTLNIELKYLRNMNFSKNYPIQSVYNRENSIIEKIYWVDAVNQLRFINLSQSISNGDISELIDMSVSSIDSSGDYKVSQPKIDSVIGGGNHTAGMIQYACNLYRINGAQTSISPLSQLIPLDKGNDIGGGVLNEVVGVTTVVSVSDIDTNYTHIKLYSIKYNSYNQSPTISLIVDKEISDYNNFIHYDDASIINTLSLAEFLFLGSNPLIPKHISSKDSRMFLFNISEKIFSVDLDTRSYGHNNLGVPVVWENISLDGLNVPVGTETVISTTSYDLDLKHDSINRDYNIYKYQSNGITLGTEGKYIKLEIDKSTLPEIEAKENKFFKDREIYRIGIEFYNKKGQKSEAKWVADIQAPEGNLEGLFNKLKVELKPEFYTWLNSDSNFIDKDSKPTAYRIIRAERELSDRTIISQGLINPMVCNIKSSTKYTNVSADIEPRANSSVGVKMPSMIRMFRTYAPIAGAKDYHDLNYINMAGSSVSDMGRGSDREVFASVASSDWRAQTFQYNKLMQMFSPDVLFGNVNTDSSNKLHVVGVQKHSVSNNWSTRFNYVTKLNERETKFKKGITSSTPGVIANTISGSANEQCNNCFYGVVDNSSSYTQFNHVYREFKGGFIKNTGVKEYEIYGRPELTEIGAGFKAYNNDSRVRYSNNLLAMLLDDWRVSSGVNNDAEQQIIGANSYGARCLTFMEGDDIPSTPFSSRKSIEQIFNAIGTTAYESVIVAEITKPDYIKYIGGIYGGNSFESKSRSSYISIGDYTDINTNNVFIKSPGDTFVQDFKFEKLFKTEVEVSSKSLVQVTEIVNIPLETTYDLKNRNDLSLSDWDNRFHPKEVEYHQYNKVYSQEPTLVKSTDEGFKFKKVKEFDSMILSSKPKIAGENIDNWTDILENERISLDGKYGPINGVVNFNDEIYTLQSEGVAHISINPRVQTNGADGLAIELGTGGVLHDYQYLSTESGTSNKWSVIQTKDSFMYYDLLNKGIYFFSKGGLVNLTNVNGLHSFMNNNENTIDLSKDNPVIKKGVSSGYNSINNEVYMTFHQEENPFTICYNQNSGTFSSFYDYRPTWYINKGQKMMTTSSDNRSLWEHFKGKRNHFYGVQYDSSITLLAHPNIDADVTFTNAEYKMEMKNISNDDIPNKTFTSVRLWNEYQDTEHVPLVVRRNVDRKFRSWKVQFPRAKYNGSKSRDRIRNPWVFIEFTLNNPNGDKMIAHDLNIIYNEY